jgi:hypothetical protein
MLCAARPRRPVDASRLSHSPYQYAPDRDAPAAGEHCHGDHSARAARKRPTVTGAAEVAAAAGPGGRLPPPPATAATMIVEVASVSIGYPSLRHTTAIGLELPPAQPSSVRKRKREREKRPDKRRFVYFMTAMLYVAVVLYTGIYYYKPFYSGNDLLPL